MLKFHHKVTKTLLFAVGLTLSSLGFANEEWSEKAHCIIYKDNKIVKRTNCTEKGFGMGRAAYFNTTTSYNIQGQGKFTIESNGRSFTPQEVQTNQPAQEGYYQIRYMGDEVWTQHTLNSKKAIEQYRDATTLKVISINSQAEQDALHKLPKQPYTCYKQTQGKIEFCAVRK